MESKLVDSNVWVGAFDEADSLHTKARRTLRAIKGVILLPDFILAETATILKFKNNFSAAQYFLDTAQDNSNIQILHTYTRFNSFVDTFIKCGANKLSFYDAAVLDLSKQYTVITFDKALAREIKKKRK